MQIVNFKNKVAAQIRRQYRIACPQAIILLQEFFCQIITFNDNFSIIF